ncbi:hypothetical protein ACFL3Z_00240 [Gemmatimonadota bacterium]
MREHSFGGTRYPRILSALFFVLSLSNQGCAPAGTVDPTATQRDSVGLVIVENSPGMALNPNGWSVDLEPYLSIGDVDGTEDTFLYQVMGAHSLPDGGVAVVNAGTREVRIYDATGSPVNAIGREGEGPGEFGWMTLGGVLGEDTLVILDPRLRRLSLVHPKDGFIRSAVVAPEVSQTVYASGVFSNGTILFGQGARPALYEGFKEGVYRRPEPYRVCDLEGKLAGDLGEKPGVEADLRIVENMSTGEPGVREQILWFGKQPEAIASGDRFYYGSQDNFEIEVMDPQGTILRLIRVLVDPVPLTREVWESYVDSFVEEVARDSDHAREMRARMEWGSVALPHSFPAHGDLKVDALGLLWVEEYLIPGEETPVWSVFDRDGVRLARVILPRSVQVLEIGSDHLIGLIRDEYEVEYVRLFRLRRGG